MTSPQHSYLKRTRPTKPPTCGLSLIAARTYRDTLILSQAAFISHYSCSHRPKHESSFSEIRTKTEKGIEATQWLQWVRAPNVICHSPWCDYRTGFSRPCQMRWRPLIGEAEQKPGSACPVCNLSQWTEILDSGKMTAKMSGDWGLCLLLCACRSEWIKWAWQHLLYVLPLFFTHTQHPLCSCGVGAAENKCI